ncbi:hypothetical protein PANDA_013187, partial [Ailuropoda melanoleuca]
MAPAEGGGEKKGHSASGEGVTREHTSNSDKCIHGVDFKKHAPWAHKGIVKFAMKETGTPVVCIDSRINKAFWAKGIRNVSYRTHVQFSRKHNQ